MGKYIKKSKISGDVTVMEVSRPIASSLRTRAAKTLALQRLRSQSPSAAVAAAKAEDKSDSSYLQLRNRRLEKPLLLTDNKKLQQVKRCGANPRANSKSGLVKSGSALSGPVSPTWKNEVCGGGANEDPVSGGGFVVAGVCDVDNEVSLGENSLEFDALYRSTRESTPCNLIGDLEPISTPGSSSTQISSAATHRRNHDVPQRIAPSTHEIEEFFAYAEQQQQRFFMEKYNFDFVNDVPLAGRYEWVQVVP